MKIQTEFKDGLLYVEVPYCRDFTSEARKLHGVVSNGQWIFPAHEESRVRELLIRTFGTDGSFEPETTTVLHKLTKKEAAQSDLWLYGRLIAYRRHYEWPVYLGIGVSVVSGKFPWKSGTENHPALDREYTGNVVLRIENVPVTLVQVDAGEDSR